MRRSPLACLAISAAAAGIVVFDVLAAAPTRTAAASGTWVGSWEAAPASSAQVYPRGFARISLRNVVRLSVGGNQIRVHLSNAFGATPLHLGDATVAVAAGPGTAAALPGTMRRLTFHGSPEPTIAAGTEAVSDPVALSVSPGAMLLITTYTRDSAPLTFHSSAEQIGYAALGDRTGQTSASRFHAAAHRWFLVDGVDVRRPGAGGAVVTFGDSITDGYRSTIGSDRRWPNDLARRVAPQGIGVLNAGISGNRLLRNGSAPAGPGAASGESALARFDRDVLSRPGVRTVVILEGINDITLRPQQRDPARIEAALRQLADRAHAAGIRVIGGTLLPFGGSAFYRPGLEATRAAVNRWIRTSGVFDAVVDFDRALRDPRDPLRLRRSYDSGDHLHPDDAGYQAMSNAVRLPALLGKSAGGHQPG